MPFNPFHNASSSNISGCSVRRPLLLRLDWFVLAVASVCITAYAVYQSAPSVLVAYFIFGLVGFFISWFAGAAGKSLFLLGYGVANIVAVILYVIYVQRYGVPYYIGGSDDLSYEREALIAISLGHGYDRDQIAAAIGNPWHNSVGYVYLVSWLIRLGDAFGGYDTLIPRVFNASLLGQSSVIVSLIAQQIGFKSRQSWVMGLWVIFFPIMPYIAAHVFRDLTTLLILLFGLHLALSISCDRTRSVKMKWVLLSITFVPLIWIMQQMRALYVIPLIVMVFSAWIFKVFPIYRYRAWHFFILLPFVMVVFFSAESHPLIERATFSAERYAAFLAAGARSAEGGLSQILFDLPQPLQTVGRIGYSVITPLPFVVQKIEWQILGLGTLVQLFFVAYLALGLKTIVKSPQVLPLLATFVIVFLGYAMGTFTFRHITQWFPFALLIAGIGYSSYKRRRVLIFTIAWFVFLILCVSYITLTVR